MILLFLKWFCFIENLIEWQNSQKAYKKQTLELNIFCTYKYKIFLLKKFFKIIQNGWSHTGNIYSNIPIWCQCDQSFWSILKNFFNKKVLHLVEEFILSSSTDSEYYHFFDTCLESSKGGIPVPRPTGTTIT